MTTQKSIEENTKEAIGTSGLTCSTWFERNRKNVRLETKDGIEIFSIWDEDVDEAVESGYLKVPTSLRSSDTDWLPHAIAYAQDTGILPR